MAQNQDHPLHVVLLEDGKLEKLSKTLFKKQLVRFGSWVNPHNPKDKMLLDRKWAEKVVANFKNKVINRIPVPLTHTDEPAHNTGELVDLSIQDDGLYGTLDIRDKDTAEKIEKDLIWDVSISFDEDYLDKRSGEQVGPALLHVALVNNPYLKGMTPFEAVEAELANSLSGSAIMLAESNTKPQGASMAQIKNDRDFPVQVKYQEDGEDKTATVQPGESVEVPDDQAEGVKEQIQKAAKPELDDDADKDKGGDEDKGGEKKDEPGTEEKPGEGGDSEPDGKTGDKPADDKGEDLSEVEKKAKELQDAKDRAAAAEKKLAEQEAEKSFDKLLSEGKILPAHKDRYLELARLGQKSVQLSDGKTEKTVAELVTDLFESGPKLVKLGEDGKDEDGTERPSAQLSEEEKAGNAALGISDEEYDKEHSDNPEEGKE